MASGSGLEGGMASELVRGHVAAFLSAFLWATSFPVTEVLLADWDPLPLAAVRIAGAGLVLVALLWLFKGSGELRRAPWPEVARIGGLGIGLGALLLVFGQSRADPVTAAVVTACMPALSAAVALAERRWRPSPSLVFGIALAVAGGVLAALAAWPSRRPVLFGGELALLAAMMLWVWYSRAAMRRLQGLSDLATAALTTAAGGALLVFAVGLAALAGIDTLRVRWDPASVGLLLWLAGAAVGLSVALWMRGVRRLGVTAASFHLNLVPLYAALLSALTLGAVPAAQWLGAALVLVGALLAQRESQRLELQDHAAAPPSAAGPQSSAAAPLERS